MKSGRTTSVRQLSNGTFRVSSSRSRSAITGRFVTQSAAARQPSKTVSEQSGERPSKSKAVRGVRKSGSGD